MRINAQTNQLIYRLGDRKKNFNLSCKKLSKLTKLANKRTVKNNEAYLIKNKKLDQNP